MFKTFAWHLIKDELISLAKALPALIILILAIWMIAGAILLSGCSPPPHKPFPIPIAPDYHLAMTGK